MLLTVWSLALVEPPRNEPEAHPRPRAAIALIFLVILAVIAISLFHSLRNQSRLEDCLMSGRSNCAPIEVPAGTR